MWKQRKKTPWGKQSWSQTYGPQNCGDTHFCRLSSPVRISGTCPSSPSKPIRIPLKLFFCKQTFPSTYGDSSLFSRAHNLLLLRRTWFLEHGFLNRKEIFHFAFSFPEPVPYGLLHFQILHFHLCHLETRKQAFCKNYCPRVKLFGLSCCHVYLLDTAWLLASYFIRVTQCTWLFCPRGF